MWKVCASRASADHWRHLAEEEWVLGVLVNIQNHHWAAVCKEGGHIFYCDSLYAPVLIYEADLGASVAAAP